MQYPGGRRDTIETATARAVRTGISQASGRIQLARMDEFGIDLVIVSSHLGARPEHYVWQGKIYSRSGGGEYPDFVESTKYGSVTGLCGANCRHNFSPYFEGMKNPFQEYDSEENQKQYELEQRQRTLERRIRETKRETMGWKTSMDREDDPLKKAQLEEKYRQKAALLKNQNAAYNDFCESTGQKKRQDRIQIAKWDRKQAAQARAAAKKVQKSVEKSYKSVTIKEKIGIQFFANKSIQKQSSRSLKKSMASWKDRMAEHILWLSNPRLHDLHWDEKTPQHQAGLLRHWQHEIDTFKNNLKDAEAELKKRGDL